MAELTVEKGFFGKVGVSDPARAMTQVILGRAIDFKDANVEATKNYPVIPIPAGFFVTGLAVKQTRLTGGESDVGVSFKRQSNSAAVGGSTTLYKDGDSFGRTCVSVNAFVDEADMLCIVPAGALTDGAVEVYVIGYSAFAEGTETVPVKVMEQYRGKLQTDKQAEDNVSGGNVDPRRYEGVVHAPQETAQS